VDLISTQRRVSSLGKGKYSIKRAMGWELSKKQSEAHLDSLFFIDVCAAGVTILLLEESHRTMTVLSMLSRRKLSAYEN
jgi:hypothetical protein